MSKSTVTLINDSTGTEHPVPASGLIVGRSQRADIVLDNPSCSRQQFRVMHQDSRTLLEQMSQTTPTQVNGTLVGATLVLQDGDEIDVSGSKFRVRITVEKGTDTGATQPPESAGGRGRKKSPPPPPREAVAVKVPPSSPPAAMQNTAIRNDRTVIGRPDAGAPSDFDQSFELSGRMVIGRDSERVDIALPHLSVSRTHAAITLKGNKAELADLNSANGTFINGRKVVNPVMIPAGTQIDIGPFSLVFDGSHLRTLSRVNNVELVCRELSQVVTNRTTGKPLTLLDQISLVIRPQEFVCIIGPSGSGKSTLLSAISGRVQGSGGQVLVSGQDLYANFESLKQNLAVVPQKDVLHDRLSVHDAWHFTAKLRLPPDTSSGEIDQVIDDMLATVGLKERKGTQIRHLSGGQIKRASLGNEILNKPSLLFLDEVTSGLDEQTDREMMRLFRQIADGGKTVVCITHNLANVERTCSLVVILTVGGKLAFVGSPEEARSYFGIERLGDVYDRLAQKTPEEWRNQFIESKHYSRYIDSRLPAGGDADSSGARPRQFLPFKERMGLIRRQLGILLKRNNAIQKADVRSLLIMFGQSVLVGVLLIMLFGNLKEVKEESWWDEEEEADVGFLDSSSTEGAIVRGQDDSFYDDGTLNNYGDQPIGEPYADPAAMQAQSMEGVEGWPPPKKRWDYSERLIFLMVISCLWFGCNNSAKEIVKERELYTRERDVNLRPIAYYLSKLLYFGMLSILQATLLFGIVSAGCQLEGNSFAQWMILCALSVTGVALGLFLSVVSKTEDMAITLVPLTLIPQIVLAGLIAPLEGFADFLAKGFVTAHWGFEAAGATLPSDFDAVSRSGTENWAGSFAMILVHFAFFAGAAMVLLIIQEKRGAVSWKTITRKMSRKSQSAMPATA
jgi:ABC-type multidrug transport system ATPase subunit